MKHSTFYHQRVQEKEVGRIWFEGNGNRQPDVGISTCSGFTAIQSTDTMLNDARLSFQSPNFQIDVGGKRFVEDKQSVTRTE